MQGCKGSLSLMASHHVQAELLKAGSLGMEEVEIVVARSHLRVASL